MPVQYEGIGREHVAVRTRAGLFDVSHMGQIETAGPDAEAFLQHLLSNDVTRLADGGAQYSVLCREDGGVLDDLFSYRLGDGFLTVTNASNHERDVAWFEAHAGPFDVTVTDAADHRAMLALQGPDARAILARHIDGDAPARMHTARAFVAGVECLVCGTGYTGEDGVELLMAPDGADLSEDRNPIEAGLGWCCKLETGFIGAEALRQAGPRELLVPFAFTGPGIPRPGNEVHTAHGTGVVTSGTHSPCLEVGIGMAYVPREAAEPGTPIEVDVRGKRRSAEVRERPLYRREAADGR